MDEYWDSEDQWSGEGKCLVCGTRSADDVCSATCSDLLSLQRSFGDPLNNEEGVRWEGWEKENDCYA